MNFETFQTFGPFRYPHRKRNAQGTSTANRSHLSTIIECLFLENVNLYKKRFIFSFQVAWFEKYKIKSCKNYTNVFQDIQGTCWCIYFSNQSLLWQLLLG